MTAHPAPIRVLIVDDEVSFGQVLVKRMAKRGIDSVAVQSGREAVRLLRFQVFDVALLDLKMEQMDGLEALRIFQVLAPEMKVVILTGHGGQQEAQEAIRLGASDYLLKPCELETIVEAIRSVLGSQPPPEVLPQSPGDPRGP